VIGRLALRSLTAHPIRSAVLAGGFGVGVAVMAILLGVAGIVLQQAQSPALVGGGDVLVRMAQTVPARMLLSGTLQADALRDRMRVASPFHTDALYLLRDGRPPVRVAARGGIPSLEQALGDPETTQVADWHDTPADEAWVNDTPERVLRQIDRFHPIPDVPEWSSSWAEWLYFNGRAGDTRFYMTFLVGPHDADGRRVAGARLQLERNGRMETYSRGATITDEEALRAPDLVLGPNAVKLEGMRYRVTLDLEGEGGRRVTGEVTLQASAGRLVPPLEIAGARGWRTGYVVPVMSGALNGELTVRDGVREERVPLNGGTGYHDHNWGFWEGVSWQWGQVQHADLSFIYGRVFPPREAANPEQMPGFVGALGPDGPLGYGTNVRIAETNDANGRPTQIRVAATGIAFDLTMTIDVATVTTTRQSQGPLGNGIDFLQIRGPYTVRGTVGSREIAFTAPGAAETFRGD